MTTKPVRRVLVVVDLDLVHLKILVDGTRRSGATGDDVSFDYFTIRQDDACQR